MSVRLRRAIYNQDGTPVVGATVEVYEVGQAGVVQTVTSDANGIFVLNLDDNRGGRTDVKYDLKVIFGGTVWFIRAQDSGQLDRLDVTGLLRLPRHTTATRDALNLGATDRGTKIYNTTTDKEETWTGSAWVAPLTSAPSVTGTLPAVSAANNGNLLRVVSGAWARVTSLPASIIGSGIFNKARIPTATYISDNAPSSSQGKDGDVWLEY